MQSIKYTPRDSFNHPGNAHLSVIIQVLNKKLNFTVLIQWIILMNHMHNTFVIKKKGSLI